MIIKRDSGDYFEVKEVDSKTVVKLYRKNSETYEVELTLTFDTEAEAIKALDSIDEFEDLI